MGAWSRLEDDIDHPNADADIKNGIGHVVARGGWELKPGTAVGSATREAPGGVSRGDGGVVAPLGDGVLGGHLGKGSLPGNIMRWQGKVDDALGFKQLLVQSLSEPQWRLEGWGVEGKVQEVGKASSS